MGADDERRKPAPMQRALINDPDHWRMRAAETRATAELIGDAPARNAMLYIAESYERMAKRAENHTLTHRERKR